MIRRTKPRTIDPVVSALCLVALLVAPAVRANPQLAALVNPVIRFDPSSSTVAPSATFVVGVAVGNATDLGGAEFTFTYNPAVVTVVTVTLGSFLGSTGRTVGATGPIINNTTGMTKYAAFSMGTPGTGPNGTGTVAQVTLQAAATVGNTALTFTQAQLTDTKWDPLTVYTPTLNSGTVRVSTGSKLGDVNADTLVDSTDALIVLSADVGMNTTFYCPMNCGDVNTDGYVDSTDALIILSYDVGMTVPFPLGVGACPSSVIQPAGCNP